MKTSPPKTSRCPSAPPVSSKRLRHVRGLDEGEKSLHALGLAASPEERWALWAKQMRSNGYGSPRGQRGTTALRWKRAMTLTLRMGACG